MASAKGKVIVSAEIPEPLRDAIDARGGEEGRSRSQLIEQACNYYLRYAPVEPARPLNGPPLKRPRKKLGK